MSNTRSMNVTTTRPNGDAPTDTGAYKLGAKGGKMAQAWQYVWDRLDRRTWADGMQISREAAEAYGLKPVSISEMLCRMRASGVIEQEMINAPTPYHRKGVDFISNRRRVHYRIAANYTPGARDGLPAANIGWTNPR
jgi:hypothetical protein